MPSRDTTPLDTRPTVFTHWATAELWRGVLDQEALWIPEPAWNTYMLCSVFDLTPDEAAALDKGEVLLTQAPAHVRATVDVPGVVRVADMDADYRRCVVTFLEHNAAAICLGLSGAAINEPPNLPDDVASDLDAEAALWQTRATDAAACSAWFDTLPLIRALRA